MTDIFKLKIKKSLFRKKIKNTADLIFYSEIIRRTDSSAIKKQNKAPHIIILLMIITVKIILLFKI